MVQLSFGEMLMLLGIASVVVAVFLMFFKKPSWGKKSPFVAKATLDKDTKIIFAGEGGADYSARVDRKTPVIFYDDGTADIKLVDGTELKRVSLEKNINDNREVASD